MSSRPVKGSGEGTRPTTSGGVDNIGGGESFTGKKNAAGEDVSSPAPAERMQAKRQNVEASKHDDSAAYNLREDLTPETNREPAETSPPLEANAEASNTREASGSREEAIRRAAYEAYQRRGGASGNEQDDWLEAEADFDRNASQHRT